MELAKRDDVPVELTLGPVFNLSNRGGHAG